MKTITIYTAAIIEIDEDKVFAPGRPNVFGWSASDTDPKALAQKVTDILKGEKKERKGLEIHMPDLPSMESYARNGSQGEPETYETSEDGTRFVVQFSGPMKVEVSPAEATGKKLYAQPAGKEEVFEIFLNEIAYPNTTKAKIEELLEEKAVDSIEEARTLLRQNPITLELFYEKGTGLFAVETEAVESCNLVSPYTNAEIVNPDNDPGRATDEVSVAKMYQPCRTDSNGNTEVPEGMWDFQVFRSHASCERWLREHGYDPEGYNIEEYNEGDIEDAVFID